MFGVPRCGRGRVCVTLLGVWTAPPQYPCRYGCPRTTAVEGGTCFVCSPDQNLKPTNLVSTLDGRANKPTSEIRETPFERPDWLGPELPPKG